MTTQTQAFPPGSSEAFMSQVNPMQAKPGDIDLVAATREILARHVNNDPAKLQAFDINGNVMTAQGLTTEVQRYKLNMFLNGQYSSLRSDISAHRGYILRDGTAEMWLQMMETYHAPTMAALGLPVVM